MYIWYDDRFTQMKRSNAHEVTLRAVLGMLFMYLCPHLVRRQMLKTPRESHNETARLCHSLTEMQNMQDSYLNSVFAAYYL